MHEKVCEVFRRIYVEKKTGVLIGEAGTQKRAVFFRSGAIVAARSGVPKTRLGELLLQHGKISQQQLEQAERSIKTGRKLGDILIEMGVLNKSEIDQFVGMQLTDIVCSLLIDPPNRLGFSALTEVESVVSKPLKIGNLIMEAARRTPHLENSGKKLLDRDEPLTVSQHPQLQSQELSLALEEKFILARVEGNQPPSALISASPLSKEATLRTLLGLFHAGLIVWQSDAGRQKEGAEETGSTSSSQGDAHGGFVDEKARAEIERVFKLAQSPDHWQALGIVQGASGDGIKTAFNEKVRRYHPDRLGHVRDEVVLEKASYIFQRAREAYEALSSGELNDSSTGPTQSAEIGASPAAGAAGEGEAKAIYARARRAYDQQDYWQAVQLAREAVERDGTRAEYYYLLGLALSQNPKWRTDAEHNFKIAAQLDPWKPQYFATLGELYLKAGMRLRARNMFEQAKAVDPSFVAPDTK